MTTMQARADIAILNEGSWSMRKLSCTENLIQRTFVARVAVRSIHMNFTCEALRKALLTFLKWDQSVHAYTATVAREINRVADMGEYTVYVVTMSTH